MLGEDQLQVLQQAAAAAADAVRVLGQNFSAAQWVCSLLERLFEFPPTRASSDTPPKPNPALLSKASRIRFLAAGSRAHGN